MIALMLGLLAAALALILAFAGIDAKRAFDNDPTTRTLSDFLRVWRDLSWTHFAALSLGLLVLMATPIWLVLHLLAGVA